MANSAVTLCTPQERCWKRDGKWPWWSAQACLWQCARASRFLVPFTPVPLTVQNFGVLLVGLLLGSRRGFAALVLYLAEGAVGMPVFNPMGLGGIAQILGVTGGYLLVYPFVAALAGFIFEQGKKSFVRAAMAGLLAEILLFAGGLSWLYFLTHSLAKAAYFGLYWFVAAEVMKMMLAAAIATRLRSVHATNARFGVS